MMPQKLKVISIPPHNNIATQPKRTEPALLPALCVICLEQIDNICYPDAIV